MPGETAPNASHEAELEGIPGGRATLLPQKEPTGTANHLSDPSMSSEDPTVARKKAKLAIRIDDLKTKIEQTRKELDEANEKLGDVDAATQVQRHIRLLHQYNEIKDVGMGLFGLIADRRGVRVKDVFEDFGVSEKD